jgi:hypothetical protein
MYMGFGWKIRKERDHWVDIDTDGSWRDVMGWYGLARGRGASGRLFGFHKMLGIPEYICTTQQLTPLSYYSMGTT